MCKSLDVVFNSCINNYFVSSFHNCNCFYNLKFSLGKQVGNAVMFLVLKKGWSSILNVITMAYLARHIKSEEFGVLAIASVMINFITTLSLNGVGEYIIYYQGKNEKEIINSAFWLNNLISIFLVVLVIILAPYWATFYNNRDIEPIVYLLLVNFLATMMSTIPLATFRKELNYKIMVIWQTVAITLISFGNLAMAFMGFGIYSLILPAVIIKPILAVILIKKSNFRPSLKIKTSYWKEIFDYTKFITGTYILSKIVKNSDRLIIGKILGLDLLGVYFLSVNLAGYVSRFALPVISNITMPLFSTLNESLKCHKAYLKIINMIGFFSVPVIGLLIVLAPEIVNLVYGAGWESAVIPFQLLLIFEIFRFFSSPSSTLFSSTGKPYISFYINAAFTPIFLLALYFSSLEGILFMVITIVGLKSIKSILSWWYSVKQISLSFIKVLQTVLPYVLASLGTLLFVYFFNRMLGYHDVIALFINILFSVLTYFFILNIFYHNKLVEIMSIINSWSTIMGGWFGKYFLIKR